MRSLRAVFVVMPLLLVAGCATTAAGKVHATATCPDGRAAPTEQEIAKLFDRWNSSLETGDPQKVVSNYAKLSILLPTVSNKPRLTSEEKADYFEHFLQKQPSGVIVQRQIQVGCDMAVDSGLYTFRYAKTGEKVEARFSFTYRWDGEQWLIISHHSSAMPER